MGKEIEEVLDKICSNRINFSDTKIANMCEIHQSDFSRLRSGSKKLTQKNFDKIKKNLDLNAEEEEELIQAFYLDKYPQMYSFQVLIAFRLL